MRCLFSKAQDEPRFKAMKRFHSAELTKRPGHPAEGTAAEPLEVNVIFTGVEATAAALDAAGSFARELGARIRLRAGIVVPVQLPLDQPLVSIEFLEQALRNLLNQSESDGFERTIHLYICRDWTNALLEVLKPDSMAVLAFHKRPWPTTESRLARALRAAGIHVVLVDVARELRSGGLPRRNLAPWLLTRKFSRALPAIQSSSPREVK